MDSWLIGCTNHCVMKSAEGTIKRLLLAIALIVPAVAVAVAQNASRWEATALSCPNGNCDLRMMKLGGLETVAKLQKINIFEKDDRVAETTASKPNESYLPIGSIKNHTAITNKQGDSHKGVQGTAFLVSPCYIISSFHVAYGDDENGPNSNKKYSATFTIGVGEAKLTSRGTPVASYDYLGCPGAGDWTVFKLDDCLGERPNVGWMETLALKDSVIVNQNLVLVGHFGDKDFSAPYADTFCKVHHADSEGLQHDCASRPGASGSPIIAVKRDGTPVVVGINAGPRGESGNNVL